MKSFLLEVRSPERTIFMGPVTSVSATAVDGGLSVLADHAPLATMLAPGPLRYQLEGGDEVRLDAGQGFLIVKDNQATVLLK
ncbi:MAG: F0F1 ATP synthase subunit epsilon [Candidatus Margulisbacteria bacterium]|nr:F0F1 ATP synthase subunit epsilon [Candidatus Margulisiibacteriota bacterium]